MLKSGWVSLCDRRAELSEAEMPTVLARFGPDNELGRYGPATHFVGREAVTSARPQAPPQRIVNVLLISQFDEDHRNLREILRHSNWRQHAARTRAEAMEFLQDNVTPVAICESELPDGTWKDVLTQLARMKCPPILVVSSRLADEALWSEVLRLGGYNLLVKPLNMREVIQVVGFAWLLWKGQWERVTQYAGAI